MIRLHAGSGAWDVELLASAMDDEAWARLRSAALRLLRARKHDAAAEWLSQTPFKIADATNHFMDEFSVLYLKLPIEEYAAMSETAADQGTKIALKRVADTITEIGPYIRHVVVYPLTDDEPRVVTNPQPRFTSHNVELALQDAELLLYSRGASSAIDRVHTALHGYLYAICDDRGIEVGEMASLTELFKAIRKEASEFAEPVTSGDQEAKRLINGLATAVDSLNTMRNRMSAAHPNKQVLEEAEAILAVNCGRTLLHYIDAKLGR